MRIFIIALSLVTFLTNVHAQTSSTNREEEQANANMSGSKSEIIVSGAITTDEDSIYGVVRDSSGPMEKVLIIERDSKNDVVSYAVTNKEGRFSLKQVNRADFLEVNCFGFYLAKNKITGKNYEVFMVRNPQIKNKALDEKVVYPENSVFYATGGYILLLYL